MLFAGQYDPFGQMVAVAGVGQYDLAGHDVSETLPAGQSVVMRHAVGATIPVEGQYDPAGHCNAADKPP